MSTEPKTPAPGGASDLWFTRKWEAAENYLWESADGCYNVVAIFGDAEDCERAAKALNTQNPSKAEPR